MKNLLLASLVTVASALGVTNPVFSQKTDDRVSEDNTEISLLPQLIGLNTPPISTKAIRTFRRTFSTIEGEKWSKIEDGYTAEFVSDGTRFRVDYDNWGNWSGTKKGYTEAKLERNIRAMIKSVYFDYNIYWIEEITLPNALAGPVYFIHIEDGKSFKNISIYDGELKVQSDYQKYQAKKSS